MKKREILKLSLNKKQISTLNFYYIRGGRLAAAVSDCEETCDCSGLNTCDCDTEESDCLPCHSK